MIARSFVERISALLPTDNFITFTQAIQAVEKVFGQRISAAVAQRELLLRRHVNLLSELRKHNILVVGNERDEWVVHIERKPDTVRRDMTRATKYIEAVVEGLGVVRYVREDADMPLAMSEEQIKATTQGMNASGITEPHFSYEGGGKFFIHGKVNATRLSELFQLARAGSAS